VGCGFRWGVAPFPGPLPPPGEVWRPELVGKVKRALQRLELTQKQLCAQLQLSMVNF